MSPSGQSGWQAFCSTAFCRLELTSTHNRPCSTHYGKLRTVSAVSHVYYSVTLVFLDIQIFTLSSEPFCTTVLFRATACVHTWMIRLRNMFLSSYDSAFLQLSCPCCVGIGFRYFRRNKTCCISRRLDPFYSKEGEPWFSGPAAFPLKLLAFWTIQASWAWMVLLPVTVSQAAAPTAAMGLWGWAGALAFLAFWAFEAGGTLPIC